MLRTEFLLKVGQFCHHSYPMSQVPMTKAGFTSSASLVCKPSAFTQEQACLLSLICSFHRGYLVSVQEMGVQIQASGLSTFLTWLLGIRSLESSPRDFCVSPDSQTLFPSTFCCSVVTPIAWHLCSQCTKAPPASLCFPSPPNFPACIGHTTFQGSEFDRLICFLGGCTALFINA